MCSYLNAGLATREFGLWAVVDGFEAVGLSSCLCFIFALILCKEEEKYNHVLKFSEIERLTARARRLNGRRGGFGV